MQDKYGNVTKNYLVVWEDPMCRLFFGKRQAEEYAEKLIDEGNDPDTIYILEVTKAWTVKAKETEFNRADLADIEIS